MFNKCINTMDQLGFSVNHNGYRYLVYAILISLDKPSLIKNMSTKLYPMIAQKFNVTPISVERCIRTAIESAWLHGDMDFSSKLFTQYVHKDKGKPTNSVFIHVLVYYLINEQTYQNNNTYFNQLFITN